MERDYFAEEIGNQTQDTHDYYSQEIDGKVPKTESFLQRAAKGASNLLSGKYTNPMPVNTQFPFIPSMGGENLSSDLTEEALRPMEAKHPGITMPIMLASNVLAGGALNTMSGNVLGKGVASAGKGVAKFGRSLKNPSKVYGEALEGAKGEVNFLDIVNKHIDDPLVKKVLDKSGVIEKYGGTTMGEGGSTAEKLAALSPKESQAFINEVKVGQNKAFLSGDATKSNQVGLSKFFSDLSKRQSQSTGLGGAKKLYGFSKNTRKGISKTIKGGIRGAALAGGGTLGYNVVKGFLPK